MTLTWKSKQMSLNMKLWMERQWKVSTSFFEKDESFLVFWSSDRLWLGETVPVRLFLGGFDLTPTYRNVHKKFSVRYFLNLVLVDESDRRYFKQQYEGNSFSHGEILTFFMTGKWLSGERDRDLLHLRINFLICKCIIHSQMEISCADKENQKYQEGRQLHSSSWRGRCESWIQRDGCGLLAVIPRGMYIHVILRVEG